MTSQPDPIDRQSDFVPTESSGSPLNQQRTASSESDAADKAQIAVENEATSQMDVDGFELVDVTDQNAWLAFLSGC